MCIPPDPAKAWPVAVLKIPAEVDAETGQRGDGLRQRQGEATAPAETDRRRIGFRFVLGDGKKGSLQATSARFPALERRAGLRISGARIIASAPK